MIRQITIKNVRSLRNVTVDLDPLTVLIGRSGAGKSNFVRAVKYLRTLVGNLGRGLEQLSRMMPAGMRDGDQAFEIRYAIRGLPDPQVYNLALAIRQKASRGIDHEALRSGPNTVFEHANHKWQVHPTILPLPKPDGLMLGSLTGVREAAIGYRALARGIGCYDFPGDVLTKNGTSTEDGYADDGLNYLATAGGIIDNINQIEDWGAVSRAMKALIPSASTLDLRLPNRDSIQVGHGIGNGVTLMDVREESEGFRRYLAHLLALYQAPPKQTVIFEHPESGIHPGALEVLFEEFDRYVESGRGQIILVTHSPQLLDYFKPEQIRVVEMVNQETQIGRLAEDQVESLRNNLLQPGELLTVDRARLADQTAGVAP